MEASSIPLRAIFFDLGDTLVRRSGASPGGVQFEWIPGAKNLLQRLRAKSLRQGMISNTSGLSRAQLLAMLPADFDFGIFDPGLVLLSSEVHIEKPDLRIFRLSIVRAQEHEDFEKSLRIDPRECLFCGESLAETIAAQQAGMLSARVNPLPVPDIGALDSSLAESGLLLDP